MQMKVEMKIQNNGDNWHKIERLSNSSFLEKSLYRITPIH
jgi:hypothetical protein